MGNVEDVAVAESGEGEESKEEAEERSADAAQGSIVVGVRETEESEFADGHGDVQAAKVSEVAGGQGDVHVASVVEVDEVEAEELEAVSYTHLDVYKRQSLDPAHFWLL